MIGNRLDRNATPVTVHNAPAVAVHYEQPQEPLRGGIPPQAAAARPAPARRGQDALPQSILRTGREPQVHGALSGPVLGESPHEIAFRDVNFAERVREFVEEDESFSSTEKVAASEGRRNVLRSLYQLCPGAAPKSQLAPRKACDFEGLYVASDSAQVAEGSPTLFHRVAELHEDHQARFRAAGKAVSSALPSRRRDRGCCSDPMIVSSTLMNPSIPWLVGALSNRRSLNFSFEEAARVESLCNGMLAAQSSGFWFFSALLHWLKELGFEAPDPGLFGQLVQEVSGSLVTAANSASGLAAFMLAKRREGVLSHFPSHVGPHFKKDLAASSFNGPYVLDDEVLASVIAASREDSHLDAQLSIAKAFTLPVFVRKRRMLVGRAPPVRVLQLLLPLPRVFRVEAEARTQILIHPVSRRYLRFTAGGKTWQFRVLCFSLSTAPQVFTRGDGTCVRVPPSAGNPDAPVSGRLADSCVISGGSFLGKGQGSQPLSGAGNCCQPREVDSNSISDHCLLGSQDRLTDSPGFGDSLEDRKVLLNSRRISVLKGAVCEVLESLARPPRLSVSPCSECPASNESSSIGSKSRLGFSGRGYPGSLGSSFSGRPSVVVHRRSSRRGDLSGPVLSRPNVLVRSLQPRLGGHCRRRFRFRCLFGGRGLSLDQPTRVVGRRERPQGSLYLFGRFGLSQSSSDNMTAVAYLRRQGGTLSPALNAVAQRILRWAEELNIIQMPQFVPGRNNVVADALSRPNQVLGLEWMLHQDVFNCLRQRWPVTIDLFASSLSHRCSVYFAPVPDSMAAGTDAMLQS